MKRPLTGLVVAFAAGILIGSWWDWPLTGLWIGALVALVGFVFTCRTRGSHLVLLTVVTLAGMWSYRFSVFNGSPQHLTRRLECRDQNVALRGVIVSDPGEPASFKLDVEAVECASNWLAATGRVLVFVSTNRPVEHLEYGQRIEFSAVLRVPQPARNPGVFDWQAWLSRQNIQFTATIRKLDYCRTLASRSGNPLIELSLKVRRSFERALRLGLEEQPRLASVLAGMVIGERSDIPEDTYADFQRTGVFHVFAISGLHVGIVTLVVVTGLRLVRIPRRWCGLVAIPLLVVYVFATGGRPGAIRALVMATVWLGGWLLVRPTDALSNLAAAALIILLAQPAQLFDGGFVLSFSVVLALVLMARSIGDKVLPWMEPDPLVPAALVPVWRRTLLTPWRWLVGLVSCSAASWVGLLPLMAVCFHLFTPISIVANIIVIPLVGLIIPIGMLSAAAHVVWPALTLTLNNANLFLLSGMIKIVDWLSQFPGGHSFVQAPPVWLTAVYYAVLLMSLSGRVARRVKWGITGLAVFIVLLWGVSRKPAVEITVLDLNDGAAVFVNLPGEDHDFLVDGGGSWSGIREVVPFLRSQGVDRLESVILTRGDKAHAVGLMAVVDQIPVRQAIHAGVGSRSKFFWTWLAQMRRQHLEIVTWRAGQRAGMVRVLHPPDGQAYRRSDDNALVLLLEYGPTRVLLSSDIGQTVERQLTNDGIQAQILIKGRHSDEPSGTDEFLERVKPEVVIQVVSPEPTDRYFEPELRERLRARGTELYRTDEAGAVLIGLTRDGYKIRTCLAPGSAVR